LGHHHYVRQFKDGKRSADVEDATYEELHACAGLRGWTLARAHARTGDPIAMSGYLGTGAVFDRAVSEFAERYAEQNEKDYRAFRDAIRDARLETV